jgi:hypothetical protein
MSGARTPRAGSPVVRERSRPCQETLLLIRGAIRQITASSPFEFDCGVVGRYCARLCSSLY